MKKTVIVLDDSAFILAAVESTLRTHAADHDCVLVSTYAAAICALDALVANIPPSFITLICDINLGNDEYGYGVIAHAARHGIRCAAMSSDSCPAVLAQAKESGADRFIPKAGGMRILQCEISAWLEA